MKLIVDIPKEDCAFYISMYNGIPFSKELKKLKKEIHKLAFDDEDGDYMGLIDDDEVMKLMNNHIARLKGEN